MSEGTKFATRLTGLVLGATLALLVFASGASADYLYRASFSGPAELEAPRRAAVEQATGNLFVVDSGHDRVLVFKPEGTSGSLLTELGVGVLDDPYGIAIAESGGETEVYVTDAGNDRIVRFLSDEQATPSFSLDATYTSPAKGTEADEIADFESPLALAPNGDLWVADRGAEEVKRFDPTGAHVSGSNFDGSTSPGGAFVGLLDIAASPGGDLYVLDTTADVSQASGSSRVDRFTAAGAYLASLSPLGFENRAATVTVNPDSGEVAVSGRQDAVYYDAAPTLHLFDPANQPVQELTISSALYGTVQGLAFRTAASDFLYVVSDIGLWNGAIYGTPGIHAFEDATPPEVTIDPVASSSVTSSSATVSGTVDPEGEPTSARFEYKSTSDSNWAKTPLEDVGGGTDPVALEADLEALEPGTTYQVRLTASSSSGSKTSATESFTTDAEAPVVAFAWAIPGSDSATLRARIDPRGEATTYRFEYGTTAAYGQTTPDAVVAPGEAQKSVSAEIEGLQPGTTYHFRAVAEHSLGEDASADQTFTTTTGEEACTNEEFRTGLSAALSDCRAYELVTPTSSEADIRIAGGPSTPDGNTVCFNTEYQLLDSDPNGIKLGDDGFCAWRRAGGWESKWVTGPAPEKRVASMGSNVYYLSSDGQRAVFASDGNLLGPDYLPEPPAPSGGIPSAYMWEAGQTRWLAPPPPPVGDPPKYLSENTTTYAYRRPLAASEDLTHGIFASALNLVPEDQNDAEDLYEWYPGGLRVVSRDAAGQAAGGRPPLDSIERYVAPEGTVSADGSRIFFLHKGDPLDGDASEAPPAFESVYMREGDEVTLVSPRRGSGPDADVMFSGASLDGETAFLETTQQLTSEPKQDGDAIYVYDLAGDELELLADAPGGVRMLSSSADGSTIVYRELSTNRLIVNRNGSDTVLGTLGPIDSILSFRVASPRYEQRALKLTPDGRVVVFVSTGQFAGSPPGTAKVYRWSADEGLENISSGDGPQTKDASIGTYATFFPGDPREEFLHHHRGKTMSGRVLSEDGSRVFFETPEALVARDVNNAVDVYEWHDGEVDLITPGTGVKSLYFDSSADGKTVFFVTFNRLIPELDDNSKRDLYVVRPGGGQPLPPLPPSCAGEACQPGRPAPVPSPPGSTAAGEGNVLPGPRIGAFGRKQASRLASKGKARVTVTVAMPGRVTALLRGKVNGRARTVAKATKPAKAAGRLRFTLRLSKAARAQLRRKGRLRLTLEVRHSRSDQTARKAVMLRG